MLSQRIRRSLNGLWSGRERTARENIRSRRLVTEQLESRLLLCWDPPTISISAPAGGDEGAEVTVSGTVQPADFSCTFTEIDWGDGAVDGALPDADGGFSATHVYADEGVYTVFATAQSFGGGDSDQAQIAMGSLRRVDEIRGGGGGAKGCGELFRDVARLADAGGQNLALAVLEGIDCVHELVANLDGGDCVGFRLQHRLHAFFDVQ